MVQVQLPPESEGKGERESLSPSSRRGRTPKLEILSPLTPSRRGRTPKLDSDLAAATKGEGYCVEACCRLVEFFSSLIAWTVLMSAHRTGFGGYYRFDSYTAFKFALGALMTHWIFVTLLILCKGTVIAAEKLDKVEFFGTIASLALVYTASIAAAAQSTSNHDRFGPDNTSVCQPRGDIRSHEKRRSDYFCQHVTTAVTFSFFTTAAIAASLFFVVLANRAETPITLVGQKTPVV